MSHHVLNAILLIILFAPLAGSLIAGLLGKKIGKRGAHWSTIILMLVAFLLSVYVFKLFIFDHHAEYNVTLYHWAIVDHIPFSIGFMIDQLTVFMMVIVTFVSLLVHIYSIGYMEGDPGYQRFFSYISGFTFAMLSLVMANNFLLLFFGWEGVGLVSYLLIGFWFKKESANYASLKAFITNRVGDVGLLLGLAMVLMYFGSIDYAPVFKAVPHLAQQGTTIHIFGDHHWSVITLACILLFMGAIGKSAQIPLHIWLEGSMEGPTPISALIHAATMVTAGVFMVARLSPMFEFSQVALSTVLIIGAATCFFMGILGIVQIDIKRVIAYSTLSQLGYMIAAQGASAFSLGMFHLMTHAAFKALLFLAAGSVIVGMHHEQDMKYMGGLRKYMPVTYVCMLIGALALSAIPPFSGYYSKDLIIEAVGLSKIPGHSIAYFFVTAGAFITAVYTFRMFFMVFHGKERMTDEQRKHIKESHWTILLPLILLAIPAAIAGVIFFLPALNSFFGKSIFVLPKFDVVATLQQAYHSPMQFFVHAFVGSYTAYLAFAGIIVTWLCYVAFPGIPVWIKSRFAWLHTFLVKKYFVDDTYDKVFGGFARKLGTVLWQVGDVLVIDMLFVNGSAWVVRRSGKLLRRLQSGYLFHYAFTIVIGLLLLLGWAFLGGV